MKKITAFSLIELSIVILIIGILIAGVTQGSRIIRQSKLSNAQTLTMSSSVSSIPNLTMWLETSLDSSLVNANNSNSLSNGDAVAAWNDYNPQSGNRKVNFSETTTPSKRPLYVANGIGGLPSLDFDGVDDRFITASGAATPIASGDDTYTIITVWKYDSNATNANRYLYIVGVPATNKNAALYITSTNTSGFVGANNNYLPSTVAKGVPYISIIRANNTLSTNNISINYNTNTATTGSTTAPLSLDLDGSVFVIGAVDDTSNSPFDGLISEIMVFDRNLKNSEVTEINEYLSKKYSINVN